MSSKLRITLFALYVVSLFSCSPGKDQKTGEDTSFRLITHNVWFGFTLVPDRKDQWIRWMQEQRPDVVSLQELNEYTAEKLAGDAAEWGHPYSVLLKEEGFPTGVTSRYPIEDTQRYLDGFHHGLIRVKIRGMYFYIIHLHPSNWETRRREIHQILDNIRALPDDPKVILAGDFNTFSPLDSIYYAHGKLEPFFQDRDEEFDEKNLKDGKLDYAVIDSLLVNGLTDLEYTLRPADYQFTGSFPTKIEKPGDHGDQRRLDYVFVSKNLAGKVKNAAIIADSITWILSDHLPMIVDFQFR